VITALRAADLIPAAMGFRNNNVINADSRPPSRSSIRSQTFDYSRDDQGAGLWACRIEAFGVITRYAQVGR
jgi:hypothetical protein